MPAARISRELLEALYARYNRREEVSPDPLEVLYRFADPRDREIAGLLAAALAYGRVPQILVSIDRVLACFQPLAQTLAALPPAEVRDRLSGFRHRWTTGEEVAALLLAASALQRHHGSLGAAFAALDDPTEPTVLPTLDRFAAALRAAAPGVEKYLFPAPADRSAAKRPLLYLRWMIRADDVDPGGWDAISPARLVMPLDTHIHTLSRRLGLTRRTQANLATAIEVTDAFRRLAPDDPTRYDFALTRISMRGGEPLADFLARCGARPIRARTLPRKSRGRS